MGNKKSSCCKILDFTENNEKFLNNSLIKKFLSNESNYKLFKNSVCHPTIQNQEKLDRAFKVFYFHIRFTAYVSSTLYFHGINLDKKIREVNYRFPVTLDQPVNDDSGLSHKDFSSAEDFENFDVESDNILDYIIDPNLYKAIQNVTSNQKEILYLVYIKRFTDSEVSILLGKTQQAVSKSRSKALKQIRRHLESNVINKEGSVLYG